jgi:DNA polymerase I
MKEIYVVDALNLLYRSYYAIGGMTNPKGESTNALFGFIRSIYKLMKDFSPQHLVVAFDGEASTQKRMEIFADYKSHRKPMPEDLIPQIDWALDFCTYAGIPYLSVPGVEADDTMGSIAKWAEKKGITTYLCSSDKDLCQLVSDHIFMINLQKDNLIIDAKKVKELYGVKPEQMIDYLAIVGDASDNIPGLEGFGPKTAVDLLSEFKTLDALLAHPEKVSGKKKQEVLAKDQNIALMSRDLATIHINVPFPKEESFFSLKTPDVAKLKLLYEEMHFMTLLKQLAETPEEKAAEKESVTYIAIEEQDALDKLIQSLKKEKMICVDVESTSLDPMLGEPVGIGIGIKPKTAYYIPLNGALKEKEVLSALSPLLSDPNIAFYGHNIKYDYHILLNVGIRIAKIGFDTILASYLLTPQSARHGIDELSLEIFAKKKTPITDLIGTGKKQKNMADVPIEKISDYCCEDVDYTSRLYEHFSQLIEKNQLTSVLQEIELPLIPVLVSMERRGIYCDKESLEHTAKELAQNLKKLEHAIYEHAGEKFNINSTKQLSRILFEKLNIKPPKKTLTGFSTSASVLESLMSEHPFVEEILNYRILEKLRSTYLDALPKQINQTTGRIHCSFNQVVAATGRLSCQNPNLQNIPIRSADGKKIRSAFKPKKAGWSFLSADYSQVELRILAHLSEDPSLLRAFRNNEDVHASTASLVFEVPLKDVTPEMRHKAKAVNFGVLYGQQAFGLSQGLSISYSEAAEFIKTYFQKYKKVKEFFEFCKEGARKTGRVLTLAGRQRPIPEINSKNPMIRAAAERLAINTPLQGTTADLIKLAMIKIEQELKAQEYLGFMLLQIHDELLFEGPDDGMKELSSIVKKIMEDIYPLKVPLVVDISVGKNWGEC